MELIQIIARHVGAERVQTVNARELHAFLLNGDHFATWIKERIAQYGFVDGQDFATYSADAEKGRPRIEYALTIDMAKELAMVERNEQGKKARQYFIECERIAKQSPKFALPDFTNPAIAARAWADQVEAKQVAIAQLEAAKPAVAFVDRYVDSTGSKGFRAVCKLLGANESNFREFMLDEKIMYRLSGEWAPYAEHMSAGRFVVKAGTSEVSNHAFNQALFTSKGVNWIAGEWAKYQLVEHEA
jgi:anti-repressor protein